MDSHRRYNARAAMNPSTPPINFACIVAYNWWRRFVAAENAGHIRMLRIASASSAVKRLNQKRCPHDLLHLYIRDSHGGDVYPVRRMGDYVDRPDDRLDLFWFLRKYFARH